MPFIGNTPDVNFTSFAKQDLTGVTGSPTAKREFTLTHAVANANEIEVFVNNVRQEPTEAYTVNGTGLTMTGDVETSDDFYIIYLGKAIQTTVPPDGSVSTAKIASSAVDLTSKVTGVLPVGNSQTNTPAFEAYVPSTVDNLTDNVTNKMPASTEVFDSDGKYDTSTYRFTPTVAGKYYVYAGADMRSETNFDIVLTQLWIYKNGSAYREVLSRGETTQNYQTEHQTISAIIDLDTDDYVEIYGNCNTTSSAQWKWDATQPLTNYFGAYKLIGA